MSDKMDKTSICLLLALKGLSARAVHSKLTAILGADAIADSIVNKYLCHRQFSSILVDPPTPRNQRQSVLIKQFLIPLSIIHSIRQLARFTCIPTTTVHRHLTQSLGFMVKHLRWVPHTLTPTQEMERATLSIELLRQLRSIERHGWQFIITLGELWFYLSADHEQIWLRVKEQPPEKPRHTLQDPKMMVTIAWNPLKFRLLDELPKDNTFNAEDRRVAILTGFLPLRPQVDGRRLVIHADNARPHSG
jgi:hypothetical protein